MAMPNPSIADSETAENGAGRAFLSRSWVETNFDRCFQLMDAATQGSWRSGLPLARSREFEFVPVRRSKEAAAIIAPIYDF